MKNKLFNLYFLLMVTVIMSADADHLVMNKVCVFPNECEMIEIFNPTNDEIDLSDYYLSDQKEYFNWVNDQTLSLSNQDFIFKFPDGSSISPQGKFTITTNSISDFNLYYGYNPDISLIDNQLDISFVGANANLSNSQEVLILFYWDESSDLVKDVDYFLWGSNSQAVYKTVDDGYPFYDTEIESQTFKRNYTSSQYSDSTYVRLGIDEIDELNSQGNGITGHDETSENLALSWDVQAFQRDISFQDIINGDYDCAGSSQDGCPLGSIDCDIVNPKGVIVDYFDVTQFGGPHAITIEDEDGFRIELTIWPDNWDIANDPDNSMLIQAPFNRFLVQAYGNVFEYDGEKQIQVCSSSDFQIVESYDMEGVFEDGIFSKASINPSPHVLLAADNERLDYSYSFPANSRVIIRVFDISGRFITTLVDKHYTLSGTVNRSEDKSSWNGRDHLGQVLSPGTYLMHIEANNFQTGKTTSDVSPVVIGVRQK
tara:strand:- start:13122 stop:14573 length:1452 start_codon:yes stop_codon:yes gene_type:complete